MVHRVSGQGWLWHTMRTVTRNQPPCSNNTAHCFCCLLNSDSHPSSPDLWTADANLDGLLQGGWHGLPLLTMRGLKRSGVNPGPGQPSPTDPPIHIRKLSLRENMAGILRPILGTQTFCWPLAHCMIEARIMSVLFHQKRNVICRRGSPYACRAQCWALVIEALDSYPWDAAPSGVCALHDRCCWI